MKFPCQTLTRDRKAAKRCQTLTRIRKIPKRCQTLNEYGKATSGSNVDTDMETTKQVSNIDTDTEGMILKADPVDTADRNHIVFLPFFLSAVGVY